MDVNWKKLSHKEGVAVSLPKEIDEWLLSPNPKRRRRAREDFQSKLVGRGEWFSASAPAIQLLLSKLPEAPEKWTVLDLVANMVGGDHLDAWLTTNGALPPADVVAAVKSQEATLLDALADQDATTRASVPLVLAMLPSLAKDAIPLLERLLDQDKAANVQASAILALARLGEGNVELTKKAEAVSCDQEREPLVRGAAAVALLRMDNKRSWDDRFPALGDWLCWDLAHGEPTMRLPWFWGCWLPSHLVQLDLSPSAKAVVALARRRGGAEELIEPLLAIGDEAGGTLGPLSVAQVLREVLQLSELCPAHMHPLRYTAAPTALSPLQLKLAKRLVDSQLFPTGGWGVAASGSVRARWLGEAPPSPLEQSVTATVNGKKQTGPAWVLWRELDEFAMPDFVANGLSPVERYLVRVEQLSEPYGRWGGSDREVLVKELADAQGDSQLLEQLEPVACDLVERFRVAEMQQYSANAFPAFVVALGLPFVRAGRAFPEEWEFLLRTVADKLEFELFDSMSEERRVKWFRRNVLDHPAVDADMVAEFYDHLSTDAFVEGVLELLKRLRETEPDVAEEIEEMLVELGEEDEALAALLPEFDS